MICFKVLENYLPQGNFMIPLLPSKFSSDFVTVIIDTREQRPVDVSPLKSIRGTVPFGDYTIRGLEDYVGIERKSLQDLVQCVGRERTRFEKVLHKLQGLDVKAVVVEATWKDLKDAKWYGKVTSSQVTGTILGWQNAGVPILLAGDAAGAGDAIARALYLAARRRYGVLRQMMVEL